MMQLMPFGLLTILFKHKRAVIRVFLVIILSAGLYLLFATPKYESVAQLVVRFGDRSIPDVSRSQPTELTPSDRREIVLANAAILGSPDLAQAAIEAFGLKSVYPDIVANPPSRGTPMDEAVKRFRDNLIVSVGNEDNVITVSLLHPEKTLAPKLVQKLIDLYIARQSAVYQNPQSDFMKKEVADAGTRLDRAQNALESFKEQWRITDYDTEVADLLKQRGDVDSNLRAAQANLAQSVQREKQLQALIKNVPQNIPAPASGEKYHALDDAETRLSDLMSKYSQMSATYNANGPAMATLKAGIEEAKSDVKARRTELSKRSLTDANPVYQNLQEDLLRTSADAESNAQPVGVLSDQLQAINGRLKDLQDHRGQFNDLTREEQIAENTYRSLSAQYEDARVKDNLNLQRITPATVISAPTVPYKTARPRKLITLLTAIVGGGILAIAAALSLEALDDRFTTAEQVSYILDLPILASFGLRQRRVARALIAQGATR
ncbi:MAG TPA: Wzz/FepE/Etk N-terminal domain-containing protein [Stellaceae bacterium]|nr:Wzz/FepE/Etk N-terminal domain-containing protein [Stellaceae bacterium]